jgi:thymidylate synthase
MPDVHGNNCYLAWRSGVELIGQRHKSVFNLITTIDEPTIHDPTWLTRYNPALTNRGGDNINDVINTIIPTRLAFSRDRETLYSDYLRAHNLARRFARNSARWGTYFERLIRFGPSGVNQLETAITKLRKWEYRAQTALVFHLSAPSLDAPRTRGGPCWQFGEIVWHANDALDLVVVYRNHDYYNKTFGNFIALGQLLRFICEHAEKTPGRLICHSVHAYYEEPIAHMSGFASL